MLEFIGNIVFSAVKRLPIDSTTARDCRVFLHYEVERSYKIYAENYRSFAAHVSQLLALYNLRDNGRITFVRFYMAEHDLRISDKAYASRHLHDIAQVRHVHVDVVQIHRADSVRCRTAAADDNNTPVLVHLGARSNFSVRRLYEGAIHLAGPKLEIYRMGFLANYGGYAIHVPQATR